MSLDHKYNYFVNLSCDNSFSAATDSRIENLGYFSVSVNSDIGISKSSRSKYIIMYCIFFEKRQFMSIKQMYQFPNLNI